MMCMQKDSSVVRYEASTSTLSFLQNIYSMQINRRTGREWVRNERCKVFLKIISLTYQPVEIQKNR